MLIGATGVVEQTAGFEAIGLPCILLSAADAKQRRAGPARILVGFAAHGASHRDDVDCVACNALEHMEYRCAFRKLYTYIYNVIMEVSAQIERQGRPFSLALRQQPRRAALDVASISPSVRAI